MAALDNVLADGDQIVRTTVMWFLGQYLPRLTVVDQIGPFMAPQTDALNVARMSCNRIEARGAAQGLALRQARILVAGLAPNPLLVRASVDAVSALLLWDVLAPEDRDLLIGPFPSVRFLASVGREPRAG